MVVALVEARANLEAVDSKGYTALIRAANHGYDNVRSHIAHAHNHWARGGGDGRGVLFSN